MSFPQPPDRPDDAPPVTPPVAGAPADGEDRSAWPVDGPGQGAWPVQGYGPGRGDGLPPSNGLATAGLVLGVVAIVLFWTIVFGLVLGVLAVIFGAVGMKRASTLPGRHLRGRGLAGVITGAAAIVLSGAFLVLALIGFVSEIDSDPADGTCDEGRFFQDPDC